MPTNFLWDSGSADNGQLVAPFNLLTTELESMANAAVAVSSVGGTAGVFNQGNTAQGIEAELFLSLGNPGVSTALNAGACLAGWFLTSFDGSTFESTTVAPPRAPDFVIPLPATTVAGGADPFKAQGLVELPALPFKVLVQNNSGQTFGNGGTTAPYLKVAPVAQQY